MGWMAAIVREPAASRGSSTGRTRAGQMAAGTARARWGCSHWCLTECMSVRVYNKYMGICVCVLQ